jgi:hypothetical protein
MEVGVDFSSCWQATLILEGCNIGGDETLGHSLHEGQISVLRFRRQYYWFQNSGLKLRFYAVFVGGG